MILYVNCVCGKRFRAVGQHVGQQTRCTFCSRIFLITAENTRQPDGRPTAAPAPGPPAPNRHVYWIAMGLGIAGVVLITLTTWAVWSLSRLSPTVPATPPMNQAASPPPATQDAQDRPPWTAAEPNLKFLSHRGPVLAVAFSPDGARFVSGGGDAASTDFLVRVWKIDSDQPLLELKGHTAPVVAVGFARRGDQVISASADGQIIVWDAQTGSENARYPRPVPGQSIVFSADGRRAFYSAPRPVQFDLLEGRQMALLPAPRPGQAYRQLAISGDGNNLLALVERVQPGAGVWLSSFNGQNGKPLVGRQPVEAGETDTRRLALSNDGRWALSVNTRSKTIKVWDLDKGKSTVSLQGHTADVSALAFSSDGTLAISGAAGTRTTGPRAQSAPDPDSSVRVWNARTGRLLAIYAGHTAEVTDVTISPDGRWVLSSSKDHAVFLWRAPDEGWR